MAFAEKSAWVIVSVSGTPAASMPATLSMSTTRCLPGGASEPAIVSSGSVSTRSSASPMIVSSLTTTSETIFSAATSKVSVTRDSSRSNRFGSRSRLVNPVLVRGPRSPPAAIHFASSITPGNFVPWLGATNADQTVPELICIPMSSSMDSTHRCPTIVTDQPPVRMTACRLRPAKSITPLMRWKLACGASTPNA